MKRDWNDIKWIFEPDGALRDIYVQEVSVNDWKRTIDFINKHYKVNYGVTGEYRDSKRIDKEYVIEYLTDKRYEKESKSASITLGEIRMNCHFFLPDQIEFDVDPKEITSIKDFELIENFMMALSKTTHNQVTLTEENHPEFPLIKIDVEKGVSRILTEDEVKDYYGKANSFIDKFKLLMSRIKMKYYPNRVKEKLIKSADEPHESTKKDENVW